MKTTVFVLMLWCVSAVAEQPTEALPFGVQVITLPQSVSAEVFNHEDYYFTQLIKLALDKTLASYGPYGLQEHDVWMTENRLNAAVMRGVVDVIWTNTTPELEQAFVAVKFSLLQELSNYRILLIRPADQKKFSGVKTLSDLRQYTGGMGSQWSDADVMRANRLPFVSSLGYGRLFQMLAAGRFDYFSRGVYQISREVELYPDLGLAIEQDLLLYYPSQYYFFVHPENQRLAERLLLGLQLAQADGSFQKLFDSIPRHQWARAELKKNQRRIIRLVARPAAEEATASE